MFASVSPGQLTVKKDGFYSIKQRIFHRELSQVTTFTSCLYLRKGEHLFPISVYCCATNELSSLSLSPKYLLTELEFKRIAKKIYLLLLITTVSPQLNPSWAAADLVHSLQIRDHIIQEACSVLKLGSYSFSQSLPQPVEPKVISKGEALSQVCLGSILWKLQLLFAENVLTTLLHL